MGKWLEYKIDELCEVGRGSSPRPILDEKYFIDGDIPWIKIADATVSGKYIFFTKEHVNEYGASFSRYLEKNSLIIAASGVSLGQIKFLGVKGCIHDGWLYVSNYKSDLIEKEYLYYFLIYYSDTFHNFSSGAAIQNINTTILRNTKLNLPPLPIQRKIASILSAYDELIENNKQRIKLLEDIAEEIYKEWFVRLRFPGYKTSKFVDGLPEGWEKVKLRDCFVHYIGGGWGEDSPSGRNCEPAYVIRGTDIPNARTGNLNFEVLRYHSASNLSNRKLLANDIVFEVSGGTESQSLGRSLFVAKSIIDRFDKDLICASFCKLIRVQEDFISPLFIYLLLNRLYVTGEIMLYQVQSTGISNYKFEDFIDNQKVLVPPKKIQNQFDSITHTMMDEIQILGAKNQILQQTRDLLLPRLISGKLSVEHLVDESSESNLSMAAEPEADYQVKN